VYSRAVPVAYECFVWFEVLTGVVVNGSVFLIVTICSPMKITDVSEERATSIFRVEE
jgi:hypothetical protein